MPLALVDILDYSPTADDKLVARTLVDANEELANHELDARTGISHQRLNHAVRRLQDKGVINLSTAIGTKPYRFGSARATGQTLRYLRSFE